MSIDIETWSHQYCAETHLSTAALWEVMCNAPKWKEWNPGVKNLVIEDAFKTGATFTMELPTGDVFASRLTEVTPEQSFTDETSVEAVTVAVNHLLEEIAGGTRITYRVRAKGPGAEEIGSAVSSDFPEVIASLIQYVERQNARVLETMVKEAPST